MQIQQEERTHFTLVVLNCVGLITLKRMKNLMLLLAKNSAHFF